MYADTTDTTLIFNMQRYSVHDGPGIRTIAFFKGCPLRCPWCSNPEGIGFKEELSCSTNLCRRCGQCVDVCPVRALSFGENGYIHVARNLCTACGACAAACVPKALKIFGERMTADAILKEVNKDAVFYKRSGGGMTISGGEPLAHPAFLCKLLRQAKEEYRLNITLETTLYAEEAIVRQVVPYIDTIFADIKLYDAERHKQTVGVSNAIILNNIRMLAEFFAADKEFILRLPLVPLHNDDRENIQETAAFIKSLPRDIALEILPYHDYGSGKYQALGWEYRLAGSGLAARSLESAALVEQQFTDLGVRVTRT